MSTSCGKREVPDGLACLCGLIGIFKQYASKDSDTSHLNKSELKSLLEDEFPLLLNKSSKPEQVKKILDALDFDGDGQVDLKEYFCTLSCLGIMLAGASPLSGEGLAAMTEEEAHQELPSDHSELQECTKPEDINQILADLDQDGDGKVDIIEYFVVLVGVGVALFEVSIAIE